jgi:hypothetical protein
VARLDDRYELVAAASTSAARGQNIRWRNAIQPSGQAPVELRRNALDSQVVAITDQ